MEDLTKTQATAEAPKAEDKKPLAPKKKAKKPAILKNAKKAKPMPKAKKKAAPKGKKKSHPMLRTRNRKKASKKKPDFKETLNIKVLPPVAKVLKAKADRITNGNFTVAVVKAMQAWNPSKKELKALKETRVTTRK